jgi:MarR family transcriptional regulator for hemolysin
MPPQYEAFGTLFALSNVLETLGNHILGELTTKQWFLLAVLTTFFTQPPSLGELADKLDQSHQNVKQLALKLQAKGFLNMAEDPKDRRVIRLWPTKHLEVYEEEHRAENQALIEALFNGIAEDESAVFCSTILKLYANAKNIANTIRKTAGADDKEDIRNE